MKLAQRLRIAKEKVEYYFSFEDNGDLRSLQGGRGDYVLYSPNDYEVAEGRQRGEGTSKEFLGEGK